MRKWHLQIEPGTWVLWGYGPTRDVVHVDRAKLDLGHGIVLPFELPKKTTSLPQPQEYERRRGFGWRWNTEDGTAGHSWHFVDTIEEAIEEATQSLEHMRHDTRPMFEAALRDVRIGGRRVKKTRR